MSSDLSPTAAPGPGAKVGQELGQSAAEANLVSGTGTATVAIEGAELAAGTSEIGPSAARGQGPAEEDQWELVPDQGFSSQAEAMLAQVLEENHLLRRRRSRRNFIRIPPGIVEFKESLELGCLPYLSQWKEGRVLVILYSYGQK